MILRRPSKLLCVGLAATLSLGIAVVGVEGTAFAASGSGFHFFWDEVELPDMLGYNPDVQVSINFGNSNAQLVSAQVESPGVNTGDGTTVSVVKASSNATTHVCDITLYQTLGNNGNSFYMVFGFISNGT